MHGRLLDCARAELVYQPAADGGFRLVYRTYVPLEAPFGYWEHHIDAASGEIVSVRETAVDLHPEPRSLPDFTAYAGPVWAREEAVQMWEAAKALSKPPPAIKSAVDGTALVFGGHQLPPPI